MLQALIHKKLKNSFANPEFRPSEDALTSSTIGVLQFLPDEVFWNLIRQSCCEPKSVYKEVGNILRVNFWEKWNADGTNNTHYVEPDVWIETEQCHIIIEAKKFDGVGQYREQWQNEIQALINEENDEKEIVFIALGGNQQLTDEKVWVKKCQYTIHKATWFNLLHAVTMCLEQTNDNYQRRILQTAINAFEQHRMIDVLWLRSLRWRTIQPLTTNLKWKKGFLRNVYSPKLKTYNEWKLSKN